MTQWFFGPAVIDRSFLITGGKCESVVATVNGDGGARAVGHGLEKMVTAAACKAGGGAWTGGHDVSGHVFMLVLATAVLVLEVAGVAGSTLCASVSSCSGSSSGEESGKEKEKNQETSATGGLQVWSLRFVLAVAGLGWWMLFMTAIWFHTWLEKWSGLTIALGTVYTIYFLPRKIPAWRDIVGIPGV